MSERGSSGRRGRIRLPIPTPAPVRLRLRRVRRNLHFQPTRRPVLLVLGFALLIAIGTLFLLLPVSARSGSTSPLVALFTATSAVCVTGLIVVDTYDHWTPFGQVVILLLMQIGGLGFVIGVASIRLLLGGRPNLRDRLLLQETGAITRLGGQQALIARAVAITFGVEAIGALILWTQFAPRFGVGRGLWLGVFHAVSAFTNGSFDLFGGFRSVADYRAAPIVLLTLAALIIIGGISVVTLTDFWHCRPGNRHHHDGWRRLTTDSKVVLLGTAILLGGGTILILVTEQGNAATLGALTPGQGLLNAFFHAAAARTAGFAAWDFSQAREQTLVFLSGLMFIGGAPGSMAGGIKITTVAALLAAIWGSLRGLPEPTLFARRIPPRLIGQALAVTTLALALVLNAALLISLIDAERLGVSFAAILYEVTSAFGTVGSSAGLAPRLSPASQLCLIVLMFIGRLGPVTVALVLTGRGREERHRYPSESIRIG